MFVIKHSFYLVSKGSSSLLRIWHSPMKSRGIRSTPTSVIYNVMNDQPKNTFRPPVDIIIESFCICLCLAALTQKLSPAKTKHNRFLAFPVQLKKRTNEWNFFPIIHRRNYNVSLLTMTFAFAAFVVIAHFFLACWKFQSRLNVGDNRGII